MVVVIVVDTTAVEDGVGLLVVDDDLVPGMAENDVEKVTDAVPLPGSSDPEGDDELETDPEADIDADKGAVSVADPPVALGENDDAEDCDVFPERDPARSDGEADAERLVAGVAVTFADTDSTELKEAEDDEEPELDSHFVIDEVEHAERVPRRENVPEGDFEKEADIVKIVVNVELTEGEEDEEVVPVEALDADAVDDAEVLSEDVTVPQTDTLGLLVLDAAADDVFEPLGLAEEEGDGLEIAD